MGSKRLIHILIKILIKFIEAGLETLFFGNGRGSFGRIEQTGQKGPPLQGKRGGGGCTISRKFPPRRECFIYISTKILT